MYYLKKSKLISSEIIIEIDKKWKFELDEFRNLFQIQNENSKLCHDWKIVIDTDTSKTSEGLSASFRIQDLGFFTVPFFSIVITYRFLFTFL